MQPIPAPQRPYTEDLESLIKSLAINPDRESVASELEVLQSIYGDGAVRIWRPEAENNHRAPVENLPVLDTIRVEIILNLPSPHEDVQMKLLVSLPPTYPESSPPQLQLLSRYIGAFRVDSILFGSILRTFISRSGVQWTRNTVCIFDGLESVVERCSAWYGEQMSVEKAGELLREDGRNRDRDVSPPGLFTGHIVELAVHAQHEMVAIPDGIEIVEAEPILDRKSSFVGRACRISEPSQVPLILSHLLSDRRIARAAHPVINAWRCQVGDVLHQDNDDDGETAAGGRLAHLLQILEVNDVLVVVTRYFGGIHLGPDRFKHINQAARNALDAGGFLDTSEGKKAPRRGKK